MTLQNIFKAFPLLFLKYISKITGLKTKPITSPMSLVYLKGTSSMLKAAKADVLVVLTFVSIGRNDVLEETYGHSDRRSRGTRRKLSDLESDVSALKHFGLENMEPGFIEPTIEERV